MPTSVYSRCDTIHKLITLDMILGHYTRSYSKFKLKSPWYTLYNNERYSACLIFIPLLLEILILFYVGANDDILAHLNLSVRVSIHKMLCCMTWCISDSLVFRLPQWYMGNFLLSDMSVWFQWRLWPRDWGLCMWPWVQWNLL